MKDLAPVVLFVYNRPAHTLKTLSALKKNLLSSESKLYIFSDGPREKSSDDELNQIEEVRNILKAESWCDEVIIKCNLKNKGLSKSIKDGITEIIDKHGKVIVLEDDTVPEINFLTFMNDGLNEFNYKNIAGISGYSYQNTAGTEDLIFTRIGSIWGWGTWKRVWDQIIFDPNLLRSKIDEGGLKKEFNGRADHYQMLIDQAETKIDSWGIQFYASYFIKKMYFVLPMHPLITNIGMDGTGTHYNRNKDQINKRLLKRIMTIYEKFI